MYNPAIPGSSNNVKEIMAYLNEPPQKRCDLAEFSEFWKSLSEEEKKQFKNTPLTV